jgi:ATP-binding cassette, subfamily B, bacterial
MKPTSTIRFYARAIGYFRDCWGQIVAQLLLMILGVLLAVLQAFPIAIMVDSIFHKQNVNFWEYRLFFHFAPASVPKQIVALAVITLIMRLAQEVLSMVQTLLGIRIGYHGLMKVRFDLFRKLQELSLAYHKAQPQGDAIYRLSYDACGFQTIVTVGVQTVLVSLATLIVMLWIMLVMNWQLTLIALSVVPALVLTTRYYGKVFRDRTLAAKQAESQLTTAIQRSVASIELVQAFGREADEYARFQNTVNESVHWWLKLHWQEVVYWLLIGSIFGVGGALMFGYGGLMAWRDTFVTHNPNGLTPGALLIFLNYLGQLYQPLNKLSSSGASIQGGVAGAQRVFEVLDREAAIADAPDAISLPLQPRTLELDYVSFQYRPGERVLQDVCVKIPPGQMAAFVGSSGVGKTTLLNLLPRFYDPTGGAIRLDGHDVRTIKLADLRRHVALVLQDSVVLPTSVAENIAYGRPSASLPEIRQAAELAGADFIDQLPDKFQTQINEGGGNLSGGQRQRIGIARALLTDSPILVLDEPTSALDADHEGAIVRALRSLKGKRTIILVSHRLSTVADSDQIFVMDQGRIVQRGTHQELLTQRGPYANMARQQLRLDDRAEGPAPAVGAKI